MASAKTPIQDTGRTNTAAQRSRDTRARVVASASQGRSLLADKDERNVAAGTSVATRATATSAGLKPGSKKGADSESTERAMTIDITSDVVCPWCFLAKRRLDQALRGFSKSPGRRQVVVRWHPFDIDPTVPRSGEPLDVWSARRYGDAHVLDRSKARLRQAGKAVGINFAFGPAMWRPHNLNAHRVIRLAVAQGGYTLQGAVIDAIMSTYFEQGEDIGDIEVLAIAAKQAGMDADSVRHLLSTRDDIGAVKADIRAARHRDITGVPDIIFDGLYRVSGAQEVETFESLLDRVVNLRRTTAGKR